MCSIYPINTQNHKKSGLKCNKTGVERYGKDRRGLEKLRTKERTPDLLFIAHTTSSAPPNRTNSTQSPIMAHTPMARIANVSCWWRGRRSGADLPPSHPRQTSDDGPCSRSASGACPLERGRRRWAFERSHGRRGREREVREGRERDGQRIREFGPSSLSLPAQAGEGGGEQMPGRWKMRKKSEGTAGLRHLQS